MIKKVEKVNLFNLIEGTVVFSSGSKYEGNFELDRKNGFGRIMKLMIRCLHLE